MISFILPTSRPTYGAYTGYHGVKGFDNEEEVHLFEPLKNTLAPLLKEKAELIIADNLADDRNIARYFEDTPMLDVKIIPQGTGWQSHGCWVWAEVLNNAVVRSSGDYLVFLTDCVSFPTHFMDRLQPKIDAKEVAQILYAEKIGDYLMPTPGDLVRRWTDLDDPEVDLSKIHRGDVRWQHAWWREKTQLRTFYEVHWDMCFGLYGIPRSLFYKLNGYDENFDGQKGLNDVEIFSRMQQLNTETPVVVDKDLFMYHHSHGPLVRARCHAEIPEIYKTPRSNYDLIHFNRFHNVTRANTTIFSEESLMPVVTGEFMGNPYILAEGRTRMKDCPELVQFWFDNRPLREL